MTRDMTDPEELGFFMAKLHEQENLTLCQAADRAYGDQSGEGLGLMSSPVKIAPAEGEPPPDVAPQERRNGRR